jgi:hypothetical protein
LDGPRYGWLFGGSSNYNHFGFLMAMICVLEMVTATRGRPRSLIFAVTAGGAVVLSYSRHSFLALLVGLVVVSSTSRLANPGRLVAVCVAGVAVSLLGLKGQPELGAHQLGPFQRLATAFTPESLSGAPWANVRLFLVREYTREVLADGFLLGRGPGSVSRASELVYLLPGLTLPEPAPGALSRSDLMFLGDVVWLLVFGSYGIVGLAALWYVFWVVAARAARLVRLKHAEACWLGTVALAWTTMVVVAGFFSLEIIARDTMPVFWLLVGSFLRSVPSPYKIGRSSLPRTPRP